MESEILSLDRFCSLATSGVTKCVLPGSTVQYLQWYSEDGYSLQQHPLFLNKYVPIGSNNNARAHPGVFLLLKARPC